MMSRSVRSLAFTMAVLAMSLPVCADEPAHLMKWTNGSKLSFSVSNPESEPFVEYTELQFKDPITAAPTSKTLADQAVATPSQERVRSARNAMREELVREGETSASDRDALTAEFFSVMRWTIVVLVVGGLVAFGIKQVPQLKRPPAAGTKMSIIESLSVGRHQVLNLVQAGGERFLVASDPGGIRSVTLLPNWPSHDEDAGEDSPSFQLFTPEQNSLPARNLSKVA